MSTEKKKTPLWGWHEEHHANLVEFGDYIMPVWYASARDEHMAVIAGAGLFDTSHMAVVRVHGPGSFDLLQWCFTRNLLSCVGKDNAPITPGKCVYGAFLDARGNAVDDSIVYKVTDEEYVVVVNAGMGGVVAAHLDASKKDLDVRCVDMTDKLGKIDIQGPAAIRIMQKVLKAPDATFDKLTYFSFKGHFDPRSGFAADAQFLDGTPMLLSRSGYTGEVGFEIFVGREHNVRIWELLMDAGKDLGLIACGLAARDSLRTGAVLPLSHQDIGRWTYVHHPWPFALPFNQAGDGFTKAFLGSAALEKAIDAPYTLTFVGNDLRKIDAHEAVVRDMEGREIGTVLTCATDMAIGRHEGRIYSVASPDKPAGLAIRGLSCGFIKVHANLRPGTAVELKDSKRSIRVSIESDVRPDRTARKALKNFL
ncbi:MAG: aminomethyl transferase family protein [Acidobacteria bacterium]|nr:aminomethyl transferase family protein [Acidobacteriota bacterium]